MKTHSSRSKGRFTLFLSLIISIVLITGCKKEEDSGNTIKKYDEITYADIKSNENSLTSAGIGISDATGLLLKAGDILFYRTNLGNLGKLVIISIEPADNYKITFKAKTFASDGTLISETMSLDIRGTWQGELDTLIEGTVATDVDFWNERVNDTDTVWTPKNDAVFYKYGA
ncbi:MAG: hypothetical protein IPH84_15590 [Bacteroidales bacterium]|nr:hypothetical protein [Bacteroidales bacterium]